MATSNFGVLVAFYNTDPGASFDQPYQTALAECGPPQNMLHIPGSVQANEPVFLTYARTQGWSGVNARSYVGEYIVQSAGPFGSSLYNLDRLGNQPDNGG